MIGTGAICDPYFHIEKHLGLTRRCLEIINRYGFDVAVQTKSTRILRDIDLLDSINKKAKTAVQMTLTTADESLCKIIKPNISGTRERFEALPEIKKAGIPTMVWLSPILPFINDTEKNPNGILDYCIEAGVKGIVMFDMGVTLREGNREYFYQALDKHFPGLKAKYIKTYGNAYEIGSPNRKNLMALFTFRCMENGIMYKANDCFKYMKELPDKYKQMSLLDL